MVTIKQIKQREASRKYRENNLEKARKCGRESMRRNREKYRDYEKKWREEHKDWIKDWQIKNRDKGRIASKKYASLHPEVRRIRQRRVYPKMTKMEEFTRNNFEKEKECGICKSPNDLQFHHWIYKIPVERKDFSTLCNYCHRVQHGDYKNG